jgi:hypothetical protein
MKIWLSDNEEEIAIETDILWWVDTSKSFDDILTDVLFNMKKKGFHVITDLQNFEGWDYVAHNLEKGEEILA